MGLAIRQEKTLVQFIATYWWLWFIGLLVVLGVFTYQWLTKLYGLAKDTVEIVGKIRDAASSPQGERRKHLTKAGLDIAGDQVKNWGVKLVVSGVLIFFGSVFGILLALSIVHFVTR